MSTLFNVNFRREAWLKEQARTRRRVVGLGVWLAYFGVLAVVGGLYLLNGVSFSRRVDQLEKQAARIRSGADPASRWDLHGPDLVRLEDYAASVRVLRRRLARLAAILPPDARLTTVALNPEGMSGSASPPLVLAGVLRPRAGQDPMHGVMGLVSALHADSAFASGYSNIRLASTSVGEAGSAAAFTIECR